VRLMPSTEVHFYNHPQFGGCSGASTVVARSGCVNLPGGVKGWQAQHLGTPGKREAEAEAGVIPVEFEA